MALPEVRPAFSITPVTLSRYPARTTTRLEVRKGH
jgi:hypothetical protein